MIRSLISSPPATSAAPGCGPRGDTAKRPASPARAGRPRVERQDIWRAISSITLMIGDFARGLSSAPSPGRSGRRPAPPRSATSRADSELIGFLGVLGVLPDRGGHLFHRSRGLFQACRRPRCCDRSVVAVEIAGGVVDFARRHPNVADRRADALGNHPAASAIWPTSSLRPSRQFDVEITLGEFLQLRQKRNDSFEMARPMIQASNHLQNEPLSANATR